MDFLRDAVNPARGAKRKLSSVETQQWMLHRYETDYVIFNHDQPGGHPYDLVAFHEEENLEFGSLMYERLEQYVDSNVLQYTGLSFTEFMEYPRHMVLRILERCKYWHSLQPKIPSSN